MVSVTLPNRSTAHDVAVVPGRLPRVPARCASVG
jgi:predicted fused transcriptional regulator/phosphomethylpyrimidine kinase